MRHRLAKTVLKDGADPDSGAALILVAVSMTILIAFAAFSVDFGWLYLNGLRIQHGADAAALAGVVYEPGDQVTAYAEARNSAAENGYVHSASGTTVTPVDYSDDPAAVGNANQLAVTIDHTVPTFFMKIFGVDQITMTKRAVAEYVLPLPMGSNLPYFGTDPSDPSRQPNFWANIHGYYTGRTMGDRYSSQCVDGGSGSGCAKNDDRRETVMSGGVPVSGGYLYGLELDATASNLHVEIFDGRFYDGGDNNFLVGDEPQGGGGPGPVTWFLLYGPDPTPLNTTDNELLCQVRYDPADTFADFDGNGNVGSWDSGNEEWDADPGDDQNGDGVFDWADVELGYPGGVDALWDTLCNAPNRGAGIYPLRVVIEEPGNGTDRGLNRFSMRASTTGNQPSFYGLGDMAIYANFTAASATFPLAEVQPVHAGKQLVIELWDPDSGNNGTTVRFPDASIPTCTWSNIDGSQGATQSCAISYAAGTFNNDHLQIRIDIPTDYTCDTDPITGNCWWTIEVHYNQSARDTTTWSAHIEGNPVKLVE
jgi:hypothetical protein